MHYHDFVGQVQHRARVAGTEDAVKATRSTLHVLSRRLAGNEPEHLASQLPKDFDPLFESGSEGHLNRYNL